MAMSGFICHDDYLAKTAKLTDEEVGRLFRALMQYHATGEEVDVTGRESIAFDFIREDIDRTDKAYKAKCETNRANRINAINNERQRSSTVVNVRPQKEKEKEKNKENISFARFWTAYPRKVNKPSAQRAFNKLNPDDALLETMLTAIEKQKASKQWQDAQYIPHPATWLNGRRWEDDLPAAKVVAAQDYPQRDYTDVGNELLDEQRKRIMARLEKGVG
jgi:hypothetical protein